MNDDSWISNIKEVLGIVLVQGNPFERTILGIGTSKVRMNQMEVEKR